MLLMLPDEIPLEPDVNTFLRQKHGPRLLCGMTCLHVFIQGAQLPVRVIVMDVFI